jgi:sarcosine oxidase, subunit gamma
MTRRGHAVTAEVSTPDPERLTQVNLRVDPADSGPVGQALGVRLPTVPNTFTSAGARWALWLGPDEWLLVEPPVAVVFAEAKVRAALGGRPGSVVDVSAQRADVIVDGPDARDLLAHVCALDLHPDVFPVGRCAQTLVAQVQVILWHPGDESYHLLTRLSYVDHLLAWLRDAAQA